MRYPWLLHVLCVVACAKADAPPTRADSPGSPQPDSPHASVAPRDSSAFVGGVDRVSGAGTAREVAVLDAVRTAQHDAFERVVFEFRGDALPDYVVEYAAERPTQCASGAAMTVPGNAYLTVRFSPAQAHAPAGGDERSTVPSRSISVASPTVRALVVSCDFEAVLSWVVGVDARRAFRVTTLRSPPRLAIDIATR